MFQKKLLPEYWEEGLLAEIWQTQKKITEQLSSYRQYGGLSSKCNVVTLAQNRFPYSLGAWIGIQTYTLHTRLVLKISYSVNCKFKVD